MIDKYIEITDPYSFLDKPIERAEVDYKKILNKDRKGCADFIKDVAAMANYGGGVIIFGVNSTSLVGVDPSEIQIYDSANLQNIVDKNLSPVPKISNETIEYKNLKFVFVRIASIENSPIICSKRFCNEKNEELLQTGSIYIRQGTQTICVNTDSQIRHILETCINHEVNRRLREIYPIFDRLDQKKISATPKIEILGPDQAKSKVNIGADVPAREISLSPVKEYSKLERDKLLKAFTLDVRLHGYSYPHYAPNSDASGSSVSQDGFVSWFGERKSKTKEIWKTFARQENDGSFYWVSTLFEDELFTRKTGRDPTKFEDAIGFMITVYNIAMFVAHAEAYLIELNSAVDWVLKIRFKNISGRTLIVEDFMRSPINNIKECFDNEIESSVTIRLSDFDKKAIALDLLVDIFQKLNWAKPNIIQIEKDLDKSFQEMHHSYEYLNGLS